jgi:hypothetical protein
MASVLCVIVLIRLLPSPNTFATLCVICYRTIVCCPGVVNNRQVSIILYRHCFAFVTRSSILNYTVHNANTAGLLPISQMTTYWMRLLMSSQEKLIVRFRRRSSCILCSLSRHRSPVRSVGIGARNEGQYFGPILLFL